MGSEQAAAVRKSDLYEHQGIAKSLLERIASLIIGDDHPNPDFKRFKGLCIVSQDTLAAMHGCSREEVFRLVKAYERDGFLKVKRFRDERGYKRCHYAMTPTQLEAIQAREMKHDEDGNYIRAKMPQRGTRKSDESKAKSLANLPAKGGKKPDAAAMPRHQSNTAVGNVQGEPGDKKSSSPATRSHQVKRQEVIKPSDKMSHKGSPSFLDGDVRQDSSAAPDDSKTNKEGKKEKATPQGKSPLPTPQEEYSQGTAAAPLLSKDAEAFLREIGCPPAVIAKLNKLRHYADKLNNTTNVLSTYITLVNRDNGVARQLRAMFCPAPPAKTQTAAPRHPAAILYRAPSGNCARSRIDAELAAIDDI